MRDHEVCLILLLPETFPELYIMPLTKVKEPSSNIRYRKKETRFSQIIRVWQHGVSPLRRLHVCRA